MSKVVYLGFHKTGTTSIGRLFKSMNLRCSSFWNPHGWTGEESVREALKYAEKYDAFEDNPWPVIYKQFDKKFKNSKFIFYERNVNDWYLSNLNHFKKQSTPMREYIYGKGYPHGNEKIYKEVYLQHSKDILNYFENRPNDILRITDFSDESAQKIGKFLDYPSYDELTMPYLNKKR